MNSTSIHRMPATDTRLGSRAMKNTRQGHVSQLKENLITATVVYDGTNSSQPPSLPNILSYSIEATKLNV